MMHGTQRIRRWAEHFRELLNQPPPADPPDIPPVENMLPLKCDKPGEAEIKRATKMLKNGKAAGPDGVPEQRH